jgi:hypothetical protein
MQIVLSDKEFSELQSAGKVIEIEVDEPEEKETGPSHEEIMQGLFSDLITAIGKVKLPDSSDVVKLLTDHHAAVMKLIPAPVAVKPKSYRMTVVRDRDTMLIKEVLAEEI